ncbi:solute carrier family 46 member 3-like isoform X2 [Homarus americanus]|uniref:solute carrier family 46 member 3-like isoform X2 n=1 Tax=Homarus americanus TaxID=6706 RepID=UPI001C45D16F|nr:solute carrier family 46 member 3-like isoform X2 [Homarus americanus]
MAFANRSRALWRVFIGWFSLITIEPMLFLRNVSAAIESVVGNTLKIERFCRIRCNGLPDDCSHLTDGHHKDLQIQVQQYTNLYLLYEKFFSMAVPMLLIGTIASWSDQRGRRVPLVLTQTGMALSTVVYLLEALFPSWPPEVLLGAAFLEGMGGGLVMFYMAVYSYMADVTSSKARTLRMIVVTVFWELGTPVGTALGAVLYNIGGFVLVFGVSLLISVVCIIYAAVKVKDKIPEQEDRNGPSTRRRKPYDPRNIIDVGVVCFKKRPRRGRAHILVMITVMSFLMSDNSHNEYLWVRRVLLWNQDQYSLYLTVSKVVKQALLMVAIVLLLQLGVEDCLVGATAEVLCVTRLIALGWTTKPSEWWVLLLVPLDVHNMAKVSARSVLSKVPLHRRLQHHPRLLPLLRAPGGCRVRLPRPGWVPGRVLFNGGYWSMLVFTPG